MFACNGSLAEAPFEDKTLSGIAVMLFVLHILQGREREGGRERERKEKDTKKFFRVKASKTHLKNSKFLFNMYITMRCYVWHFGYLSHIPFKRYLKWSNSSNFSECFNWHF